MRTDSKPQLAFSLVFMCRRLLFITIAFGIDHQAIQIMLLIYLNTAIIIYQQGQKPLKARLNNQLEIFNELTIHISTIHMIFFTEWIGDLETQYELGWSMLGIISFNIAANLCVITYFGSK